jgi:hypothetical protein
LIQSSTTCEPNVAAGNREIRARNPCSVLETDLVVPVAGRCGRRIGQVDLRTTACSRDRGDG